MNESSRASYFLRIVFYRKVLSLIAIVLGGLGLVASTTLRSPYATVFPLGLFFAGTVSYFLLRSERTLRWSVSINSKYIVTVYFLILTASIILYSLNGVRRNITLVILTAVLYSIVVFGVLTNGRMQENLSLVVLTAVFHRSSTYWSSELFLGNDVLYHNRVAGTIAETGSLSVIADKYAYAPLYHIQVAEAMQIFNIDSRITAFITIVIPVTIVPLLLIYRITLPAVGRRFAIISSVLYASADIVNFFFVSPQVTTMGMLFGVIIIYVSLQFFLVRSPRYLYIAIILFGVLLLTHQMSSLITTISVTSLYVGTELWGVLER